MVWKRSVINQCNFFIGNLRSQPPGKNRSVFRNRRRFQRMPAGFMKQNAADFRTYDDGQTPCRAIFRPQHFHTVFHQFRRQSLSFACIKQFAAAHTAPRPETGKFFRTVFRNHAQRITDITAFVFRPQAVTVSHQNPALFFRQTDIGPADQRTLGIKPI